MRLLKKISIVLLLLLVTNQAIAQEFKGGVIIGISSSQLSGDHLAGFNKIGVVVGAFTSRAISEKINGKMELLYIQKGSKNPNPNFYHQYYLDYIEIPILLQYKVQHRILLEMGIQIGVLVNQKEEDFYGTEWNMLQEFNKTDIGLCIGLNYELNNNWSINSRFSNTFFLTPVRNHWNNVENWYNKGQYNTVLSFVLQYMFN